MLAIWDARSQGLTLSHFPLFRAPLSLSLSLCLSFSLLSLSLSPHPAVVQAIERSCKETNCVNFSPSGSQLATGNDLCEVQLWDLNQVKVRQERVKNLLKTLAKPHPLQASSFQAVTPATLCSHSGVVYGVAYSADGGYLASCSSDRTCKIWSLVGTATVANLAEDLAAMLNIGTR